MLYLKKIDKYICCQFVLQSKLNQIQINERKYKLSNLCELEISFETVLLLNNYNQ